MFKVFWLAVGGRPTKTCNSEDEVWEELGKSWGCYQVHNADGTIASQFIPF